MRFGQVVIVSIILSVALVGSALLVASADAAIEPRKGDAPHVKEFVGYWMGIDPLDGGDSRRGITSNGDGTLSMIGRDTVFTLCDDTDRAVITLRDGVVTGRALVGELVIDCLNTGASVTLDARYDLLDKNIVSETLTSQDGGELVDRIIFHRVSEK